MSDRSRPIHSLLAGAVCGVAWSDLLLGLNPHLLAPAHALALAALCAALGAAAASPLVLVPRPAGRPSRFVALFFGVVVGIFALFAEVQRLIFRDFIGGDARRILGATGVVAGAAAALALVIGIRAPRRTRRPLLLAGLFLALFLVVPVLGRRTTPPASLATPPSVPAAATRSLLVVGLDGVSWELLTAAASEGSLPTFAELLREGAAGPLTPLGAFDRAALWTTAATGKRPLKHGVVAAVERATPAGKLRLCAVLPGSSLRLGLPFTRPKAATAARRSLTFWEILERRRHGAAVLNWPFSDPAVEGFVLWASERAFEDETPGPLATMPKEAARFLSSVRVAPSRLDRPLVRSLAPEELAPDLAERTSLAGAARDLSVLGAGLGAVPQGPNNVFVLVLSGARLAARPFGAAGDARYWGLPVPGAEAKARALKAYYRFLDDLLRDLVEREGKKRTICVFTPASWGPPPPLDAVAAFLRGEPPTAEPDAGDDGFILLHGAGIRAGVRLTSAHVLDLAPTLLVLAGEPMARDMDGRVLAEAFEERFAGSASIPIITTFEPDGPQ
jgi:hypothetical protein